MRKRPAALLALLALASGTELRAADTYSAEDVKAAFLMRFPTFVEWPASALQTTHFSIAVLGDEALADRLERSSRDRTLKERPVEVRRIASIDRLGDAQVLYIASRPGLDLRRILSAIATRPVLVVTDDEHGLDSGAAVSFLLEDRRVRFEVSQAAAERVGLRVSSELLSVAVRVQRRAVSP